MFVATVWDLGSSGYMAFFYNLYLMDFMPKFMTMSDAPGCAGRWNSGSVLVTQARLGQQ